MIMTRGKKLNKMKVPERKVYDVAESDYKLKRNRGCVVAIAKRTGKTEKSVRCALNGDRKSVGADTYVMMRLIAIREYEGYPVVVKEVKL